MSDINRKILEAEKILKQKIPESKKRKWLKAQCSHCGYRFEYEPTEKFRGELRCPECGKKFKVNILDDYVGGKE